jgi:hypothetical protein
MTSSIDWLTQAVVILISLAIFGAFVQLFMKANKQRNKETNH